MREISLALFDLNLLVIFETIMREGSVSRAADRLHLSQSAVSHALARLREALGDPLFVRTPRGMQPTPFAEEIAPRIQHILVEIETVIAPPSGFDPACSTHSFTIGMTDYIAFALAPGLAERLAEAAQGLRLTILPTNARAAIAQLEAGEIDLYVGRAPEKPPEHIGCAALLEERALCVGRRGHPAFRGEHLTAEAFLAADHLHVSPFGAAGLLDAILARLGAVRRIALTIGDFLVAPAILERTDLLALLPERIAVPMIERYALEVRDPPFDLGRSAISQIWHRRLERDPASAWLRGEIAALAQAPAQTGKRTGSGSQ